MQIRVKYLRATGARPEVYDVTIGRKTHRVPRDVNAYNGMLTAIDRVLDQIGLERGIPTPVVIRQAKFTKVWEVPVHVQR